uniref:Putative ovule protein n=1 Tax=Solanum chacoense TaxID=4108 RepID=A0A0V0GI42_SOLCH
MDDNSAGGRAVDSGSGSDNWQKYLNLSEENDSAASASPPVVLFFQRTFGHVPCTGPWGGSAASEPYSFHFPNGSMEFTFLVGSNPRSG